MTCYLCNNSSHKLIKDRVRDREDINVLQCDNCGLVFLDKKEHINPCFYEQGGMGKSCGFGNAVNVSATDQMDTEKRFSLHKDLFKNKHVLDFGCGRGSLLKKLKDSGLAAELYALEPDKNCQAMLEKDFKVYSCIDEIPDNSLDVISLFHVMEHLKEPLTALNMLHSKLTKGGRIIIEVPSSTDVLLNLYDSKAFADFSYWSCHLYLFNQATLTALLDKTEYKIISLRQYQRYTLANHLHWLAKGQPGGHEKWGFLDDEALQKMYEKKLAEIEQCDSLLAVIEK